jgi:transposase
MGRQAVYDLLHRLGYSDLMPRPHHDEANPEVQEFFKEIVGSYHFGSHRPISR